MAPSHFIIIFFFVFISSALIAVVASTALCHILFTIDIITPATAKVGRPSARTCGVASPTPALQTSE